MFHEVPGPRPHDRARVRPARPRPELRRRWNAVERIRPALFSQAIVVPLFHRHRILTQVAADNVNIIKLLPPLDRRRGRGRRVRRRPRRRPCLRPQGPGPLLRARPHDGPGALPGRQRRPAQVRRHPERRLVPNGSPPAHRQRQGVPAEPAAEPRLSGQSARASAQLCTRRPRRRHRGGRLHRLGHRPRAADAPGRRSSRWSSRAGPRSNLEGPRRSSARAVDVRDRATTSGPPSQGARAVFHTAALFQFWAKDPHGLLRRERRGDPATSSTAALEAGMREDRLHEHGRDDRPPWPRADPVRRDGPRPHRPPLRPLQAVQVRRRARGAPGRRRGRAAVAWSTRPSRSAPATSGPPRPARCSSTS